VVTSTVRQPAVLVVVVAAEVIVFDQESEVANANVTLWVLGAEVDWRMRDLRDA
jgi:hypothetical protein